MARVELRRSRFAPPTFVCIVCYVRHDGSEAVYHPRASRRSYRLVDEACGLWLAGIGPSRQLRKEAPDDNQLTFDTEM